MGLFQSRLIDLRRVKVDLLSPLYLKRN